MDVEIEINGTTLTAKLKGEIDHHSTVKIRLKIDSEIDKHHPQHLILDFTEVTFMDSSGIGLVMGRLKYVKLYGGNITVQNAPSHIGKVMHLAGIDKFVTIK